MPLTPCLTVLRVHAYAPSIGSVARWLAMPRTELVAELRS